jgi:hypothetical protein
MRSCRAGAFAPRRGRVGKNVNWIPSQIVVYIDRAFFETFSVRSKRGDAKRLQFESDFCSSFEEDAIQGPAALRVVSQKTESQINSDSIHCTLRTVPFLDIHFGNCCNIKNIVV